MIRITGLKLNINHTNDELIIKAAKELKISKIIVVDENVTEL